MPEQLPNAHTFGEYFVFDQQHHSEDLVLHPNIVNINSPVDAIGRVEACFKGVDFDTIRQSLCPFIETTHWAARLLELGCIGLISQMSFEQTYATAMPYEESSEQRRDFPQPPRNPENRQNEGEGRPPRRGEGITVVEPLGMYVENLQRWMTANSIPDSAGILNSKFSQQPAILLCPEAMTEFAGRLYRACQHLRHPFDSEQEAFAFILNSVLLHEFGHHFFPTQKCGGQLYLNEALANLFALYGLKHGMKTNLLAGVDQLVYKTFLFQHSAYSAYRPLNATFEVDPHTRFAVGMCFTGSIWQWASLKGKSWRGFPIDFGASRKMAICLDYEASQSLWYDEIGGLIGRDDPWLDSFWGKGLAFHAHLRRNVSPAISPDFLADLYERRHLNSWMDDQHALGIMRQWWSCTPESRWPADCLDWKENKTLTNLSDSAAEVVSSSEEWLEFDNLQQLSESAAVILGKSGRFYGIEMPKLNTLSSTAAAGLCGFRKFFLRLDGLTSISDDTAQCLGKHHGELSLRGVSMLSEAAAEGLAKIEGKLDLDGLTNLSDAAAVHLGKHCGELSLNGLQTLTEVAAEHLGKHRGTLLLNGLTSLTDYAIEILINNSGKLSLHNITMLTDTAAKALGRHVGYLHLGGVKSLSDVAAEELSKHQGDLCLFGLTSLTDAAAESLSRHKGMLSLSGLRDLSSAAAEYLCSHDGRLIIQGEEITRLPR